MTKIAINGRFLNAPKTGVTRVGFELLRAIREIVAQDPSLSLAISPRRMNPAVVKSTKGRPERTTSGQALINMLSEQIFSPLIIGPAPLLCFCNVYPVLAHKPIVWLHDAQVLDAPQSYSNAYRLWHQSLFRLAVLRGVPIVTVSHFSKERLMHHGAKPSQLHVIYNGGDHLQAATMDDKVLSTCGLSQCRYILIVGSRAIHKNIPFTVNALAAQLDRDVHILVAGLHQYGRYAGGETIGEDPRVHLLPAISDGELRALYAKAQAVVLPSYFEGFGLPAAEAMWEGTPLALSNRAALPEIGGDAALYFDPSNAQDLVSTVQRVLSPDVQAILRANAAIRRKLYTWDAAARRALELVQVVANS